MSEPILVVAAHPDDEVLGCGGTIAKLAQTRPVHILILGEGVSSRYDQRQEADEADLASLREDANAVASMLGAESLILEGLPDNRFDELPLLDVIKRVERIVKSLKPTVIYTHHPGDLNIDHLVTFRAVMTATRPTAACPVRDVYTFEVNSSTEWAFQQFEPVFRANVFVNIATTLDVKVRAMARYESEARVFPHPRSEQALRAVAHRWGAVTNMPAAEAFHLVRSIRE